MTEANVGNTPPDAKREGSKERVLKEFRDRVFLISEDNAFAQQNIQAQLREARGTEGDEKDPGIISAVNAEEALAEVDKLLENAEGGKTLTLIADLNMPFSTSDTIPDTDAGASVIQGAQERVKEWNEKNSDNEPITLEIVINSTEDEGSDIELLSSSFPGIDTSGVVQMMSGWEKTDAVPKMKERFESQ